MACSRRFVDGYEIGFGIQGSGVERRRGGNCFSVLGAVVDVPSLWVSIGAWRVCRAVSDWAIESNMAVLQVVWENSSVLFQ